MNETSDSSAVGQQSPTKELGRHEFLDSHEDVSDLLSQYSHPESIISVRRDFSEVGEEPGLQRDGKFLSSGFGWIDVKSFRAEKSPTVLAGAHILELLSLVSAVKASDLYLQDNEPPKLKVQGRVYSIGTGHFDAATTKEALKDAQLMDNTQLTKMTAGGTDGTVPFSCSVSVKDGTRAYDTKEKCRFRGNGTFTSGAEGSRDGISVTFRRLGDVPPTLDELGVPVELREILFPSSGVVICSGETNSGKTTLVGGCLRQIVTDGSTRVVATYEDPIEFDLRAIPDRTSIVGQTDLGHALGSFTAAIRDVARRSSKITFLGEIRDEDSSLGAINLSASGQLVYATTHANSVEMTMSRMLDLIGSDAKRFALFKVLIDNVRCIINQQLVIGRDGQLLAIQSWLGFTTEVRRKLTTVAIHDLPNVMQDIVREHGWSMIRDIESKKDRFTDETYNDLIADYS